MHSCMTCYKRRLDGRILTLHEFRIGGRRFGVPRFMAGSACVNERKVRLCDVLDNGGKAEYTYDFGDGWKHSLVVEKVLMPDEGQTYPLCVDGKLHGPPENCGGIGGFYRFLEAIADPNHEEHEDMLEWIGGSFDPQAFSIDAVNNRLRQKFPVGTRKAIPRRSKAGSSAVRRRG